MKKAQFSNTPSQSEPEIPKSLTRMIIVFCFLAMLADGYDLGIYGAVLPSLLEYKSWSLTPVDAGTIGSYALMGMLVGAIVVGTVTDLIGRKWTLVLCMTVFSISMGLVAMATSPEMFGLFRFIAGIGLGGVIPTTSALTIEYSPTKKRSFNYALMFTGYSLGVVLGALLSILFLKDMGWRFMFWIGVIPLAVVPFIIKSLPESVSFLLSKNRIQKAETICMRYGMKMPTIPHAEIAATVAEPVKKANGLSVLFSKKYATATIAFWLTYIMGFYLVYGLNTWLPKIMTQAGYSIGSSLSFLLILNLSATIGALLAGVIADKMGSKRIISIAYLSAAVSLALLTLKPSIIFVYLFVGIAGFGSVGITQILNAYVTKYFPSSSRATAIGWGLGIGRIGAISGPFIIGWIVSMNFSYLWGFYTFVGAALIACVAVLFVPAKQGEVV
jgi:MFS transporter, AAHS family, benzoate transport protein